MAKRATALKVVPSDGTMRENRLNDLTGAEWLFWTSTIFETFYPADATHRLRKQHGAMKPPEVMAEIIRFFTKQGEEVLDPFAGVGGTLLGAAMTGRKAIGYEINSTWVGVYHRIQREFVVVDGRLVRRSDVEQLDLPLDSLPRTDDDSRSYVAAITAPIFVGDCMQHMSGLSDQSIDAVITDPPYGSQHGATGFKDETNFNMRASADPLDFSNSENIVEFLERMEALGCQAWRVLKPGRYLVLMVGDRYMRGEFVPLGVMVADTMRRVGFQFKGMRIWWNKATQRPLRPYAVKTCFVPNIVHQNILVLRKSEQ